MNLICFPSLPHRSGTVAEYPSDKSISHRILLLAMLDPGSSVLRNVNLGGAVRPLIEAMGQLGVKVSVQRNGQVVVGGLPAVDGSASEPYMNLGSSSAAARMLIGVLAGTGRAGIVDGDASLRPRPIDWVVDPLRELGGHIDYLGPVGQLPVRVRPSRLRAGQVELKVGSAQAMSAVLYAAFAANVPVTVRQKVRSRDHTQRLMQWLGARIREDGDSLHFEPGRARSLDDYEVPVDPSAVVYPVAAWLLARRDGILRIPRVCLNETRTGMLEQLRRAGAPITYRNLDVIAGEPVGDIEVAAATGRLAPLALDDAKTFHAMIDEVPLAVALATQIDGHSVFKGLGELTFKETNRITSTAAMLDAFGAKVEVNGDRVDVHGPQPLRSGRLVPSFGDHRLAMSAAALGAGLSLSSSIDGGTCFRTSFPGFTACMQALGFRLGEA
jgi:3-phosphoshikimate 1-carboxyvinyltransferase